MLKIGRLRKIAYCFYNNRREGREGAGSTWSSGKESLELVERKRSVSQSGGSKAMETIGLTRLTSTSACARSRFAISYVES